MTASSQSQKFTRAGIAIVLLFAASSVSAQPFTDLGLALPGYGNQPSAAWADTDNDGWLDFYVTGNDGTAAYSTGGRFCLNQGGTNFVALTNVHPTFQQGDLVWGDFDNDGDLDLGCSGVMNTFVLWSQVRRNDGSNVFSYVDLGHPLWESAFAAGDGNNDGWLDIAATGWQSLVNTQSTWVYRNTGAGGFNPDLNSFAGVTNGDLTWGDFDNDLDLDLVMVGLGAAPACMLFENDGTGALTDSGIVFPPGWHGASWGDCDNDGDLDLAYTRHDFWTSNQVTVVYRNNGNRTFSDLGARLPGGVEGSVNWGDFDNDGWLDLLVTGAAPSLPGNVTRIYRNNHNGTFTDINAGLPGLSDGNAEPGDFDNDGDLDILMTGNAPGLGLITRVYRNDTAISNAPPAAPAGLAALVSSNSVRLSWLGATDPNQTSGHTYNLRVGRSPGGADVVSPMADLTTGRRKVPRRGNTDLNLVWQLKHLAPGTYFWSVQAIDHSFAGSPFAAEASFVIRNPPKISAIADQQIRVNTSSAAIPFTVSDAENNASTLTLSVQAGDTNLLPAAGLALGGSDTNRTITVTPAPDQLGTTTVTLWLNDPDGYQTNRSFQVTVFNSGPTMSDLTNQIVLPQTATSPQPFTVGDIETAASNLVATASSSNTNLVPVANVVFGGAGSNRTVTVTTAAGGRGTSTIIVTVTDSHGGIISDAFVVTAREYVEVPASFQAVDHSAAAWGDYNNDGRLDLVVNGTRNVDAFTALYRNEGDGTFTEVSAGLPATREGGLAWGDYNNDGWLDLALTGNTNGFASGVLARIYRNNGDGTFTDIAAGLPGVYSSSVAWADLNRDGRLDLVLGGNDGTGFSFCRVYQNNGDGTFTDRTVGLPSLSTGSVAAGDRDRDGDLDVLLTGWVDGYPSTEIYLNNGSGGFDTYQILTAVSSSTAAWGDYDNDGRLDVLLAGNTLSGPVAQVHRNYGSGFTQVQSLPGVSSDSPDAAAWGDVDNDGRLDILLSGFTVSSVPLTAVYRNNGDNSFTDFNTALSGAANGPALFGDYDNDGRLDLFVAGNLTARLYRNLTPVANTPPAAPVGLATLVSATNVAFLWNAANDSQTSSNGLSYNLRIGTSPGGSEVVAALASTNGWRRVVALGNAGSTTNWTLMDPPISGTYYWSVQAIDATFAGSPFATEQTFTANFPPSAHTFAATGVSNQLAVLHGKITAKGFAATAWFELVGGNITNLLVAGAVPSNAAMQPASLALTNLIPETDYTFRLVASNEVGVAYGETLTFFTGNPPLFLALPASNITGNSARLRAQVNPNRSDTTWWFEYGPTPGYGSNTSPFTLSASTNFVTVGLTVSGLAGATVYHYRVVASNEFGLAYGPNTTFMTRSDPIVTTLPASNLALTSASLNATVNPNGLDTFVYFEYGPTTNYGFFTDFLEVGNATNNLPVSQLVTNLPPGATNFFRVIAANSSWTSYGQSRSFVTLSPFTNAYANLAPGLLYGMVAWGDFNNDGWLDLAASGQTNANVPPACRLYRNDGNGSFTPLDPGFVGVRSGTMAWGDLNNDGRLDLLLTGATNASPYSTFAVTRVYRNDGDGVFTDLNAGLPGLISGAAAWGDFNNDGWQDVILTGVTNVNLSPVCRIFLNTGNGSFTPLNTLLPGTWNGSLACADFNNDGRLDVLLTGMTNLVTGSGLGALLLQNNGNGTFTRLNTAMTGVREGSAAWADFDGDGDLDIVLAGNATNSTSLYNLVTRVYRNNGGGNFTDTGATLTGIQRGTVAWGDFDNDGRPDVWVCGEGRQGSTATYFAAVYRNAGNGAFELMNAAMPGAVYATGAWGDYDRDGQLDLVAGGQTQTYPFTTFALYCNLWPATNAPPSAPGGLNMFSSGNAATFRWDAAADEQTTAAGLTYNLRLGTSPGGSEVISPLADANDGTRRVVTLGNTSQRRLWTVTNLPPSGTFYWAVQAVDGAFAGSPFSAEQMFVLSGAPNSFVVAANWLAPDSVRLEGYVSANGFESAAWFEWGATTNYGNATSPQSFASNAAAAAISITLTNLAPVTPYHCRLVATNLVGINYSTDLPFLLADLPLIVSQAATNVTASQSLLRASVNPSGGTTKVFFEYGPSPAFGLNTVPVSLGNGTNTLAVSNLLSGLAPDQSWFFRTVASNLAGVVYGPELTFTTAAPPQITSATTVSNGFVLTFTGATNLTYDVQASTNLVSWSYLGKATLDTNGWFRFLDTNASNHVARFYRVLSP